jgi:hypothetical protein
MKKGIFTFAALIFALTFSGVAEACSASTVMDKADNAKNTEVYETVLDVLEEPGGMVETKGWERPEAVEAAVGTVLYEYQYRVEGDIYVDSRDSLSGYTGGIVMNDHDGDPSTPAQPLNLRMDNASHVRAFLDLPSNPLNYVSHSSWLPADATIADHAAFHGDDWEIGEDRIYGGDLWVEEEPEVTEDHAG